MTSELFDIRITVYYEPAKIDRYDYKVKIFRDLRDLKDDWNNEYKPIFELIKKELRQFADLHRL